MNDKNKKPVLRAVADEVTSAFDELSGKKELKTLEPLLEKIPKRHLRGMNVNPPKAVSIGLGYARLFEKDKKLFEDSFRQKAVDLDGLSKAVGAIPCGCPFEVTTFKNPSHPT